MVTKFPRITLDALWLAMPTLLTFIYVSTVVDYPVDFWHSAATGRQIAGQRAIPCCDCFTYTIFGQPIVNQSWGAEWAMYELSCFGGFALAQFAAALCYATALAATTAAAWSRCRNVRATAILAIAAFALSISNFGVRTQAISVVLFALEMMTLWRWPNRWRTVAIVGAVELLWTNTHGAFPLGVALPGLFLVEPIWTLLRGRLSPLSTAQTRSAWRSVEVLTLCVMVSAAAAFCNPWPSHTLSYVFHLTSRAVQRGVEEWQRTSLDRYTGVALLTSALVAIVVLVTSRAIRVPSSIRSQQSVDSPAAQGGSGKPHQAAPEIIPVELLLLFAFCGLAWTAERMVVWWAMVLASALSPHMTAVLSRWFPSSTSPKREPTTMETILNGAMLVVMSAMTVMSTPWTRAYNPALPPSKRQAHSTIEPLAMVEFLQQSSYRGRTFAPLEWGGYLTWHCDPAIKVFLDTRIDFFPDRIWEDYQRIGKAEPGWEDLLDQYRTNLVVWDRRLSDKLPRALSQTGRWENVYQDSLAVIFARKGSTF